MIWPFGKRRFQEVVSRQLTLFASDRAELVTRARTALQEYDASPDPTLAQMLYAEYDDLAEDVELRLYEMCEYLLDTIEDPFRTEYLREFDRQARRAYGDLIPRLRFDQFDI